jgi:hypothetical protein
VRNLQQYPVTKEEMTIMLTTLIDELENNEFVQQAIGNMDSTILREVRQLVHESDIK